MGDWSQLLPDLLIMIARRIKLVEDFMVFRGVCTSWRAAGIEANYVNSWPTIPLLMLAEEESSDDRQFYSLSRGKIWRTLSLPEAKGKKCIESRGWFVTSGGSGELSLLHPFSRAQIELPHQTTFPEYEEIYTDPPHYFIYRAVLSANPSDTTEFVLVVIYGCRSMLGFWTPGDNSWRRIKTSYLNDHYAISDANFYDGKLYAISYMGIIWVWDVSEPDPEVAQYLLCIDSKLMAYRELYLVESSSALLIVARERSVLLGDETCDGDEIFGATDFRVVQPDLIKGGWKEITSLAERAIFIGHNGAFSVDITSFPGVIKSNCIYFTDDGIEIYSQTQQGGGKDMGVYNLEDGKIERFDGVQSMSLICPPLWVTPSL